MKIYREAGGKNAVLANVAIDLADRPGSAEARKRLKRLDDMGFDEVLLISHSYAIEDIERARDLV